VNYFARKGFNTYWVDKPFRGRSPFNMHLINAVARGDADASTLPNILGRGKQQSWTGFRMGPALGQLNPGSQFPLEAADQFFAQLVPDFSYYLRGSTSFAPNPVVTAAVIALFEKIGPSLYIGHSQGAAELPDIVRERPDLFAGVINIEGGCPPLADAPLYKDNAIPFMAVYADYTTPPASCQQFVDALNTLGGHATNLSLPTIGIHGNGHMMMLEKNSDQIAQVLIDWIVRNVH
jgi:hypothetical protein